MFAKKFPQPHEVLLEHLHLLTKSFVAARSCTSELPILASSSRKDPGYRAKDLQNKGETS
jgi:hypothetical protein